MKASIPHYLLYCESGDDTEVGQWRFLLRSADGAEHLEAHEIESDIRGERLDLLAVVRGLEALDQPSRVTLVTTSTYVREGIRHGVWEWRKNDWRWESFGQMVPVKHQDLWKRVDRALAFHRVECRTTRIDSAHAGSLAAAIPEPHLTATLARPKLSREFTTTRKWPLTRPSTRPATRWRRWKQWFAATWMTLAPSLRLG